jgi:hypothetical protein
VLLFVFSYKHSCSSLSLSLCAQFGYYSKNNIQPFLQNVEELEKISSLVTPSEKSGCQLQTDTEQAGWALVKRTCMQAPFLI